LRRCCGIFEEEGGEGGGENKIVVLEGIPAATQRQTIGRAAGGERHGGPLGGQYGRVVVVPSGLRTTTPPPALDDPVVATTYRSGTQFLPLKTTTAGKSSCLAGGEAGDEAEEESLSVSP
jgi:hypothetical protein